MGWRACTTGERVDSARPCPRLTCSKHGPAGSDGWALPARPHVTALAFAGFVCPFLPNRESTSMPKEVECCRMCQNERLAPVLALGRQHLTGVFPRNLDQTITCGPLELVKCQGAGSCGLLQLGHSYDLNEMYGSNYGYRSGLNTLMVEHLARKSDLLQTLVPLAPDDLVLDIGSNDGTLLSNFPETSTRAGMDPTGEKFRRFYPSGVELVADFFSEEVFLSHFGPRKAKIITSIAMFYDLERPVDFAGQVARVLADDGVWHFEQSYMPSMLEKNAYDTVCHEHSDYYGLWQVSGSRTGAA